MGNVNVNRIGRDAQRDQELSFDERLLKNVVEVDPWRPSVALSAQQILALAAALGAAWLVVLLVLGVVRGVVCWGDACYSGAGWVDWLIVAWMAAPVVGGLVAGVVALWGYVAQARAVAARMAVTRDRYGNPVSARAVAAQRATVDPWQALLLADATKRATAPYELYRGADALSLTQAPQAQAAAELNAPAHVVVVERPTDWLPWLGERPHLMLAAESGAGKSVLENVVLAAMARRPGSSVVIVDCHWSPLVESDEGRMVPKWGGVPPTAVTYDQARDTLRALRAEYELRMAQLRDGVVVEGHFPPILIVVDETPEMVREIAKLDKADIEAKRMSKGSSTWDDAMVILGSGGRKINMHGHLLTQSPLVEDIGMNSAMRRNFFRIALAHAECRKLIGEEPDRERREALLEALRGRRYPAALERNGEVWLVSRDGLLELMPDRIEAPAWEPSVRLELAPRRAAEPEPDDEPDEVLSLLVIYRREGLTRDQAREKLRRAGLEFENALWTKAGRLVRPSAGDEA